MADQSRETAVLQFPHTRGNRLTRQDMYANRLEAFERDLRALILHYCPNYYDRTLASEGKGEFTW